MQTVFRCLIQTPNLHAQWLNSLSYLEYRGFRKIVKSHSSSEITQDLLKHCAEEVRHALFFKRQAIRTGGTAFDQFSSETMLREQAFKNYFFAIDDFARKRIPFLKNEKMQSGAYLIVTWLVEVRALQIYEAYETALRAVNAPFSLAAILREEELHLTELGEAAKTFLKANEFDHSPFLELEELEFQKLWTAIGENLAVEEYDSPVQHPLSQSVGSGV